MSTMKFYYCPACGNILYAVEDAGVIPVCCGETMEILPENETDAAFEKHIPAVYRSRGDVFIQVGEKEHPMTADHYIPWVVMLTDRGVYFRALEPGDTPRVHFHIGRKEVIQRVCAYCNLHGLWAKPIDEDTDLSQKFFEDCFSAEPEVESEPEVDSEDEDFCRICRIDFHAEECEPYREKIEKEDQKRGKCS